MLGHDQPTSKHDYLFDNRDDGALQRFDSLGALFNPVTFRHLDALGLVEGWRCWEVGVGGPSIARWMSERVGPAGRVLATDIDVRWVQEPIADNVEIRRHDVVADDLPPGSYDLVHERLVLLHIPGRETAVRRMIDVLRPGGWVLLEDFDANLQPFACPDPRTPEERLANRVRAGIRALLAERGADLTFGRRLPRLLRSAGLVDVAADAYLPIALPAAAALEEANVVQTHEQLIAGGHATAAELDAHLTILRAGALDIATPPLISAWGRKR
jgi:SAM-dependent methyltransferase